MRESSREQNNSDDKAAASESNEQVQHQQFGCDRVVIVRDQESKARLPLFMKNMLCLTVYECKGLEFEEVVLFNFFQDSQCKGQWDLLKDIVISQKVTKRRDNTEFLDFEMLEAEEAAPIAPQKIGSEKVMIDTRGKGYDPAAD